MCFFFSSRRRHTRCGRDWSSDVCSSDLRTSRGAGPRPPTSVSYSARYSAAARLHEKSCAIPLATRRAQRGGTLRVRRDWKSVVEGKSVDLGGRRIIEKKRDVDRAVIDGG